MKQNIIRLVLSLLLLTGVALSYTPEDGLQFGMGTQVWAMDDDEDWGCDDDWDYDDSWDIDDWSDWADDYNGDIDVNVWDDPDDFFENADWDVVDDVLDSLDEMDYDDDHISDIRDEFYEHNDGYEEHVQEEQLEEIQNEINEREENGEFHPYYYDPVTNTLYTDSGTPVCDNCSDRYFNGDDLYRDDNGNRIPDRAEDAVLGGSDSTGGNDDWIEDDDGWWLEDEGDDGGNEDDWEDWEYWDDSENGGDYSNLGPYPKANNLFRNNNMTPENWQVIENMLNKITQKCLGNALYNGLLDKLDGKQIIIEFVPKGADSGFGFSPNGPRITIDMSVMGQSHVLFHEMFHAFQSFGETSPGTWESSLMNGEVEARYATYLYFRGLPEYSQPPWSLYVTDPVWREVERLADFIDAKGNLLPGVTEARFRERYDGVVHQLRTNPHYHKYHGYPLDATRNSSQNFKNQKTLSGGC